MRRILPKKAMIKEKKKKKKQPLEGSSNLFRECNQIGNVVSPLNLVNLYLSIVEFVKLKFAQILQLLSANYKEERIALTCANLAK